MLTHDEMMAKAHPVENKAPASEETVTQIVTLADGSKPEDCVRWWNPQRQKWVYQAVIDGKIYILRSCKDGTYLPK